MSIVGYLDDPVEHVAVHRAQREALNAALGTALDTDVAPLLDDPATHLEVHSQDRLALAAAGSEVTQDDLGWLLCYPAGHVATHLAEAKARTLFTMSVLLRASTAVADGWTSSDPWVNEGSLGSSHDATVGDITPVLADGKFTVDAESGDVTLSGFEIADGDLWNPVIGTDDLTIVHEWQPLSASDSKSYWHYDGVDLATAGFGFVSEELDFGPPYQFYVWSANDLGPGNPADIGATIGPSLAKRVDVIRIEGTTLTAFRDGVAAATFDLTGRGPIAAEVTLRLGQPCDHYNFAAVDRALTDAEIAALSFTA